MDTVNNASIHLELRWLYGEAISRFERVTSDPTLDGFVIYSNHGDTCFTISLNKKKNRFNIGISLTGTSFIVEKTITKTALFGDVQRFFNMIYDECQRLADAE